DRAGGARSRRAAARHVRRRRDRSGRYRPVRPGTQLQRRAQHRQRVAVIDERLSQAERERDYYKRQADELAGENHKLGYAIAGLRQELSQKRQGFALLSELQQSIGAPPQIARLRAAFDLPFFVCVPVKGERDPIALLLSGRLTEAMPFYAPLDQGDADTLQAIAGLISASIRNMRVAVLEEADRLKTEF